MVISIAYCGTCNYRPIAARLASDIEREIGIRPVLEHSRQIGAFEVSADGKLIFSKTASGRFPDNDEIIAALRSFREET